MPAEGDAPIRRERRQVRRVIDPADARSLKDATKKQTLFSFIPAMYRLSSPTEHPRLPISRSLVHVAGEGPLLALYPRSGTNRQWQQRGGYDPFTEVSGSARYLRKAEDLARSKALRPTRAHRVVGVLHAACPNAGLTASFTKKGAQQLRWGFAVESWRASRRRVRTPFGGGNTDWIRSRAT